MDDHDNLHWFKADRWCNNSSWLNIWCEDHIDFIDGDMVIRLDNQTCQTDSAPCSTRSYASGEYTSNELFGYGYYETRLKAAKGDGLITAFFLYSNPSEYVPWDEIDIEILGKGKTNTVIANYWTDGISHSEFIPLGFDASEKYHTYAFLWTENDIQWYVDNKLIWSACSPTSKLFSCDSSGFIPSTKGNLSVSLWASYNWEEAGDFTYQYTSAPYRAYVDWIKYTPLTCDAGETETAI